MIAIPRISSSMTTTKDNACMANVDNINRQIEYYMVNTGNWPASMTDVTENPNYFPDDMPVCPYDAAYVIDPGTHHVTKHSHENDGAANKKGKKDKKV